MTIYNTVPKSPDSRHNWSILCMNECRVFLRIRVISLASAAADTGNVFNPLNLFNRLNLFNPFNLFNQAKLFNMMCYSCKTLEEGYVLPPSARPAHCME